jgi:hypothetical protein
MKLTDFIAALQKEEVFDLPLLEVLSGQNRDVLTVQLHRWIHDGKVVALRRGLYTLSEAFSSEKNGARLANVMVHPSYLTGLWALSWYGLIPESVYEYTSAVTSHKQFYENKYGRFSYRRLKADLFRGWETMDCGGADIRVATPVKALLDHLYWTAGDPVQVMQTLRFQPEGVAGFSWDALTEFAEKWGSPKLTRFAKTAQRNFAQEWEDL